MDKTLFTPGPVQLHPRVTRVLARQVISHRVEEFRRILEEAEAKLAKIYRTNNYIALLTGSGTLAVESMIYSLLNPGDKILVVHHGVFSRRVLLTAKTRRIRADAICPENPGSPIRLEEAKRQIDEKEYDALFIVYNETSIGLTYRDIKELSQYARKQGLLVLVDAVSALAGEELETSGWRLDAVASASQKAIAAPPGLSFVALSSEALEKAKKTREKPGYLDLSVYYEFYKNRRETPYTPSVNLIYALNEALDIILEHGLNKWIELHRIRASYLYDRLDSLGLKPLVRNAKYRSNTVTAFYTTSINVKATTLASKLYEKGLVVATGIGELREKVLRIGVMGNITLHDLERLVEEITVITS